MFMEKILPLLNTISQPKSDEEKVEKPKKYHKGTENVLRRNRVRQIERERRELEL